MPQADMEFLNLRELFSPLNPVLIVDVFLSMEISNLRGPLPVEFKPSSLGNR